MPAIRAAYPLSPPCVLAIKGDGEGDESDFKRGQLRWFKLHVAYAPSPVVSLHALEQELDRGSPTPPSW